MTHSSTQTEENNRYFTKITEDCANLLRITEQELFMYKNDKAKLKDEVVKILEENQRVHSQVKNFNNSDIKIDSSKAIEKHEQLANDAISKLKGQISILREERDTIQTLWKTSQDTINSLEKEIFSYRNQIFKPNAVTEIKEKYSSAIDLLESTIRNIRKELDKQISINKELFKTKNLVENKLRSTEAKLLEQEKQLSETKNLENNYTSIKDQLKTAMKTNHGLEKSLIIAKKLIDERFIREKLALEKVQEALLIAENAMAEKEEALNREIVIREESDHLSSIIKQVIEEAARKVENDVEKLRKSYENKIDKLKESQKEALADLDNQIKITERAEIQCQNLENKIKKVLEENITLETDVQVASQAIVELELKIAAIESLMDHDIKMNKISDEREKEIEQFFLQNQNLKEKWKKTTEDITLNFEKELEYLQEENTNLKAENEELRIKLMQLN